jgi:hypothetical protein
MYSPNKNKNVAGSMLKFNNSPKELLSEYATANRLSQPVPALTA